MKSENAWLGTVRICLRGNVMSEQITREVHEIVGQFVLDMGRTEYAMDEFVWAASRTHPEIMESFQYKYGKQKIDRPPKNASERLDIACHFFKNIDGLKNLHDKTGKLDIDEWFENLRLIKDFRNDIVHGNIDLTYTSEAGTYLRFHKYSAGSGSKKGKIKRDIISLESIREAIEHIRYDRAAFRAALAEIDKKEKQAPTNEK
jgi:hypothetical protein